MGSFIIFLVVITIYLFFSHTVAAKARSNGSSYGLWFVISLIIDPILAFVLVLMFTSDD